MSASATSSTPAADAGGSGSVRLGGPALRACLAEGEHDHAWQLLELQGHEAVNSGFDYTVTLQHREALAGTCAQARAMLGRELRLCLPAGRGAGGTADDSRCIAGIVTELDQLGHDQPPARRAPAPGSRGQGPRLRLRLRPWTCLADVRMASRVHQDRSVADVLRDLLGRYDHAWELRLRGHYPRLDYLVQFDESDGEFLRRQCARWGLHFHFEHRADGHCLVLGDGVHALRDSPLRASALLELRAHARPDEAGVLHALYTEDAQGVASWISGAHPECHLERQGRWRASLQQDAVDEDAMVRWHGSDGVCRPRRDLEPQPEREDDALAESRLNLRRAGQARRGLHRVVGSGTLPGLAAGYRVRLRRMAGQPDEGLYVQRTCLHWQAGDDSRPGHRPAVRLEFEARPVADDVCPTAPREGLRALGVQTATVLEAAASEPSFTDAVGRLRVRLHWAHADARASTCWVRLVRPAAGEAMGCATWPRPGQEVLVDFVDDDPDTPVCLGLLRNPANAPPWPLPASAEISGWHTRALHDARPCADDAGSRLLFDDAQDALHAQLACDSEASALRLGRHAPVRRGYGRGDARGEGFELRSDGGVVLRAARALAAVSGAASRAAQDIAQPLRACRRQLGDWLSRHAAFRPTRDAHAALPEGPTAALRAGLETDPGPILLHAQGGLHLSSPRDGQVHAGAQLAGSAERDVLAASGDGMVLDADGAVAVACAQQGLRLTVSEGPMSLLAPAAPLQVHARGLLRMGSGGRGVLLQGPGRLILEAAGQSMVLGPDGVRHVSSASWRVRVAGQLWGVPATPRGAR